MWELLMLTYFSFIICIPPELCFSFSLEGHICCSLSCLSLPTSWFHPSEQNTTVVVHSTYNYFPTNKQSETPMNHEELQYPSPDERPLTVGQTYRCLPGNNTEDLAGRIGCLNGGRCIKNLYHLTGDTPTWGPESCLCVAYLLGCRGMRGGR